MPAVLERPGGWPSRGLEAELEAARQDAQRAQHREEHLKAECERLQLELKHLQDSRQQVGTGGLQTPGGVGGSGSSRCAPSHPQEQSERDMAWVKKMGDDQ